MTCIGNRESQGRVRAGGFTLIELMVVVAMVGILMAVAVVYIKPTSYAATTRGFSDQTAAFAEAARDRAIATHAWQRVVITSDSVTGYQAPVTGFVKPADDEFLYVGKLASPSHGVQIVMTDATPHIAPATAVPAEGAGLPVNLDFAPDGTAQPLTLFISDAARDRKARVLVFRATGSVLVYDTW